MSDFGGFDCTVAEIPAVLLGDVDCESASYVEFHVSFHPHSCF
jgi:hypothetical protein